MNESEWLNALKPGDKVAIPGRWNGTNKVGTVERMTATQIVLIGGDRYRRDSGRQVGGTDSWNVRWIRPVTQDFLDVLEKEALCNWVRSIRPHDLPVETLRAMKAGYEATRKEQV